MPDNNHIPDSGKVNEPPKTGNTELIKSDPPVPEQPAPVKPEPPAVEAPPKTMTPPTAEKATEGKLAPDPAEQPAPTEKIAPKDKVAPAAGKDAPPKDKEPPVKPLPEDKQVTIPGMEPPAGKVVDFAAVKGGAAKGNQPNQSPEAPKPRRGRPPKEDKAVPPPRDKKSQSKGAGLSSPGKKNTFRSSANAAPAVEPKPSVPEQPAEPKDATRAVKEEIVYLDLSELHAFKDHPFEVRDDAEMQALVESVKTGGVNQPALVRPREGGGYEIVAGHRRQKASELAGYRNMPCIVREMTDDEAILAMTDDNLRHREHILPMEKARALKQQVEAIKHQGVALKNVAEGDLGKRSTEVVGTRNGINYKQVQRYIRLNELVPELQKMVDEKKLSFTPAVEISFIRPKHQQYIAVSIEGESAPSLSQAQRLRELDRDGKLNPDIIDGILSQEKKEVDKVILTTAELSKYFGQEATPRQMKDQIMALLDEWKEKQPPEKKAELEK